jgi:tRNA (adenine37-N6)-methyltransferase
MTYTGSLEVNCTLNDEVKFKPIGIVHSELVHRYETPRQGILSSDIISIIKLNPHNNFEQALQNINGFEKLWIIYLFHLNKNWKPMVHPPRVHDRKVGVFATRAPFRPNPIGLSCVKLEKVEGLNIYISGSDILDGTPVLDIKPYLPWSDSFPESATGWVKNSLEERYEVVASEDFHKKAAELKQSAEINLWGYARIQLEFSPADTSRKRISKKDLTNNLYSLSYRNWQINYEIREDEKKVFLINIST